MSLAILAASTFTIISYINQNAGGGRKRRRRGALSDADDDDGLDDFAPVVEFNLRNTIASSRGQEFYTLRS